MCQRLVDLGINSSQIALVDGEMQEMIEIAAKVTRTATYKGSMRVLDEIRALLETAIEIAAMTASEPASTALTTTETAILKTLDQVVLTTALSYQQLLQDLNDSTRVSYRGTASELREVLRELFDHLAPDAEVMKTGIKVEQGQTKPTMKQKTVFILNAREVNETQRKTASDATEAMEGRSDLWELIPVSIDHRGRPTNPVCLARTKCPSGYEAVICSPEQMIVILTELDSDDTLLEWTAALLIAVTGLRAEEAFAYSGAMSIGRNS